MEEESDLQTPTLPAVGSSALFGIWIPIKEGLPVAVDSGQERVLVWDGRRVWTAILWDDGKFRCDECMDVMATHWMPCPAPSAPLDRDNFNIDTMKDTANQPTNEINSRAMERRPEAICSPFGPRIHKCVVHQNTLNTEAPAVAQVFQNGRDALKDQWLKEAVDNLTAGLGICQLAGISPQELLERWADKQEKVFPELANK